jgi:preprotein translocase subunit Sec61beta
MPLPPTHPCPRRRVPARRESTSAKTGGAPVPGAADATSLAHYTDEGTGLQVSPATVLTMALLLIGTVVVLHIAGKFSK